MFLNISQKSQENTGDRVSYIVKLQASACNFIEKETLTKMFPWEYCEIFNNSFFTKHLQERDYIY